MIEAAYLAFALAFAVLVLAGRSWRLYWRTVVLATGVFVVILAGWVVVQSGLSRPLPAQRSLFSDPAKSGELLWVDQAPPDFFYLMIRWEDRGVPRYYRMPWSDELAAQLEQAMEGLADGEHIGVSPFLFDGYDFETPEPGVFHPMPVPSDPLKESPPDLPQQQS